jgi:hypothetical protein
VTVLHGEAETPIVYPTLSFFLDALKEPTEIFLEATFESFNRKRREYFITRCAAEGHLIHTIPNRLTARVRRIELGIEDKTDDNDVQSIRHIAKTKPSCLRTPMLARNDELIAKRVEANRLLMLLRCTGTHTKRPRSDGYNFESMKDGLAEKLVPLLPPFESLTPTQKIALGNGGYNLVVVAAVAVAAKYADNQREFDSIAGLSANGYPSQIRADLHHYNWAGGNQRSKLIQVGPHKFIGDREDITMSDWRRELRWLYHRLRPLVFQIDWPTF